MRTGHAAAVVAVGGVIGSSMRWLALELAPVEAGHFPWTTLTVNLVGCIAIGLLAGHLAHRPLAAAFVVTGVLGGFTTFSAFAVETDRLVTDGRTATALVYVAASVAGGLAAVLVARRARPLP